MLLLVPSSHSSHSLSPLSTWYFILPPRHTIYVSNLGLHLDWKCAVRISTWCTEETFFYMNASNYIFKNLDGGRMIRKSSIIFERLHVTMAHISPSWSSSITKHFFAWWEIGAETRASFVTIDCMEPVTTNKCEGCLWMTSRIKFLVYRTSLH